MDHGARSVSHARSANAEPAEAFARSALDGLSAHVCVLDVQGNILSVNAAWRHFACANAGDADKTAEGINYFDVCEHTVEGDSEGADAFAAGLHAVLEGRVPQIEVEYPCHSPTERRWFRARATHIDGTGPARVVVAHEEITAKREMDLVLRESATRYRLLLASMADGVFVAEGYRFVFANAGLANMLGYTVDEFTGLAFDAVIDPVFLALWTQRFEARIRDDEAEPPRQYELRLLRKCGQGTVSVELRARRFEFEGRIAVLGVMRDITDHMRSEAALRELELQLRDAQKMEAMGRFAGAVAHDFNNLLTIIRGTAELMAQAGPSSPTFAADLDAVAGAVDRAAALTTPLQMFGRHQHADVRRMRVGRHLNEAVAAALPLPGAVSLQVDTATDAATAEVLGDSRHFGECIRHLLHNAAEARPRSGCVQLRCRRALVTEPRAHRFGVVPSGDFVMFEVVDDGLGMTSEMLDRLFEPFFTTKPQGQGPGLGLAVVYGVVRRAGGSVCVESQRGRGTCISIFWPNAPADAETLQPLIPTASVTAAAEPAGAADTILVVDDEPGVRLAVARMLEREGFRVLLAESGASALAMLDAHRPRVCALVTDVRMPEMTGVELVETMVRDGVELPVLFISGQLDAPLPTHWPSHLPRRFLRKPFTISEMSAEIAALAPRAGHAGGTRH